VVDVGDCNAGLRRPFYVPLAGSARERGTESVIYAGLRIGEELKSFRAAGKATDWG
jgi:hypothetical protein